MNLHHFVGAGFPRTNCAICGGPLGAKQHHRTADVTGDELHRERKDSIARRRAEYERVIGPIRQRLNQEEQERADFFRQRANRRWARPVVIRNCKDCGKAFNQKRGKGRPVIRCPKCRGKAKPRRKAA